MLQDRYGNTLSTSSPAGRGAYVAGVGRLIGAMPGVGEGFAPAVAAPEGCALGHPIVGWRILGGGARTG